MGSVLLLPPYDQICESAKSIRANTVSMGTFQDNAYKGCKTGLSVFGKRFGSDMYYLATILHYISGLN